MKIQTRVGIQNVNSGSETDLRSNRSGDLIVSQGHAKYQEAVLNGDVYIGANLAGTAVVTQAGLSATTPALALHNPVGSGVYLSLLTITVDITASPAAAVGLMFAYNLKSAAAPTATTLAQVTNAILDLGKLPIGQCYRISTLAAAPLAIRYLGGSIGASAISGIQLIDNIDGSIIISPGVVVSIQTTSAASIISSFVWQELAL